MCSFKIVFKVGVEELIVNAPLVSLHTKNRNNAKSELSFEAADLSNKNKMLDGS
jgi:hypothetical protein